MTRALPLLPRTLAALAGVLLLAPAVAAAGAGARELVVQVRDTPPSGHPSFYRGADRSFTVSTGGSGDRDDQHGGADNGTVIGTSNAVRELRVRTGERVRVDLPALQTLQFHVPVGTGPGRGAASATAGGNAASGASAGAGAGPGPGVSGVVTFEAVSAFAARFAVEGARVRIELTPLRAGTVQAPLSDAYGGRGPVVLSAPVGEWVALGDTDTVPARSLTATAEPVTPASVWVRVYPVDEAAPGRP